MSQGRSLTEVYGEFVTVTGEFNQMATQGARNSVMLLAQTCIAFPATEQCNK